MYYFITDILFQIRYAGFGKKVVYKIQFENQNFVSCKETKICLMDFIFMDKMKDCLKAEPSKLSNM